MKLVRVASAVQAFGRKALPFVAACTILVGGGVAANASTYVVTLEQVGPDVVAAGTGAFDLTGLSFFGNWCARFPASWSPPYRKPSPAWKDRSRQPSASPS